MTPTSGILIPTPKAILSDWLNPLEATSLLGEVVVTVGEFAAEEALLPNNVVVSAMFEVGPGET